MARIESARKANAARMGVPYKPIPLSASAAASMAVPVAAACDVCDDDGLDYVEDLSVSRVPIFMVFPAAVSPPASPFADEPTPDQRLGNADSQTGALPQLFSQSTAPEPAAALPTADPPLPVLMGGPLGSEGAVYTPDYSTDGSDSDPEDFSQWDDDAEAPPDVPISQRLTRCIRPPDRYVPGQHSMAAMGLEPVPA